ncbi:hypothetical protein LTR10_005087 [Elasticomyces elasticus]|nr:hypothetical protein LTR10_005087 [Elasticomyces elasticus]KAK4975828.1 hypothetical protein LTR42_003449 [Elasticomyces elasticus]
MLHVINPKGISVSELLEEAYSANASIRTVIIVQISSIVEESVVDKTATIGGWQRANGGKFESMGIGGEFRDKDGKCVARKLEVNVGRFLPHGTSNDHTDAAKIVLDMGNYCPTLTKDEAKDVAMQAEPWVDMVAPDQHEVAVVDEVENEEVMEDDEGAVAPFKLASPMAMDCRE